MFYKCSRGREDPLHTHASMTESPLSLHPVVLWKAGYRFKYRSMLTAVVGRSGPLIPGSRVFLKPSPQQQKQLQDHNQVSQSA